MGGHTADRKATATNADGSCRGAGGKTVEGSLAVFPPETLHEMTNVLLPRQFNRLAAVIADVRRTCDQGTTCVANEEDLHRTVAELEAILFSAR
jgi:hypothetical protein